MENLWIETGDMSGGSRNQIEFDEDLAVFFTSPDPLPDPSDKTTLSLSIQGRPWTDCDLAAKVTTFGVVIFRLGLVTAAKGGEEYPQRVALFKRAGGGYFNVTVADLDSPEHQAWKQASTENGTLGRTGGAGGREFGYF